MIRKRAGIAMISRDYDQSGIVMTLQHERPHDGVAEEHFLPSGPFATLPLTGNRTSSSTTSGRYLRTAKMASAALAASPVTIIPGSTSVMMRRPMRTTGWSSTINTRMAGEDFMFPVPTWDRG
jgi:2-polyprenyl-6-methoxyphenol hydroxylase-like FAD-dependent oxidoreductase